MLKRNTKKLRLSTLALNSTIRTFGTVVLAASLAIMYPAKAEPANPALTNCQNSLNLCDDSNSAGSDLITRQRAVINDQDKLIIDLTKQRNDAISETNKGLPFYYWVLFGVAGGVVMVRGLRN